VRAVIEHPLLIPTDEGPVGGIASEPDRPGGPAVVLLQGYGRPARSGVNSFWARTARAIAAELGATVLRVDYSREGETLPLGEGGGGQVWKRDLDLRLLRQALPWFRDRVRGEPPLHLVGVCSGARLAVEYAAGAPQATAGLLLLAPHLRALVQPTDGGRDRSAPEPEPDPVDAELAGEVTAVLEHVPVWVLNGEHDTPDVGRLARLVGTARNGLEHEIVPGKAIHMLDHPDVQEEAGRRLRARLAAGIPG
jgi:dienelactone hydrolase